MNWRWLAALVLIGAVVAGFAAADGIGPANAAAYGAMLFGTGLVSLACGWGLSNFVRLPIWINWCAPAALSFGPMFVGYFPIGDWLMGLSSTYGWQNVPSPSWTAPFLFVGWLGRYPNPVLSFERPSRRDDACGVRRPLR